MYYNPKKFRHRRIKDSQSLTVEGCHLNDRHSLKYDYTIFEPIGAFFISTLTKECHPLNTWCPQHCFKVN